eukprot:1180983-Prorocentrum_minimum.AAC.2
MERLWWRVLGFTPICRCWFPGCRLRMRATRRGGSTHLSNDTVLHNPLGRAVGVSCRWDRTPSPLRAHREVISLMAVP